MLRQEAARGFFLKFSGTCDRCPACVVLWVKGGGEMEQNTRNAGEVERMEDRPKSEQGFEAAYEAYGAMVYRLAMVYLGRHADAEDVTQEAFVRLLYKAPRFSGGEHEKRWLLRVTANLCRDQLRGFWRKRAVALEGDYPIRDPEDFGVADAIVRLPEKYKAVLHLHYYEGYSVAEVAEILKLSPSAVKMRLSRGREMLKLEMEG